jgi:hypothetical protein
VVVQGECRERPRTAVRSGAMRHPTRMSSAFVVLPSVAWTCPPLAAFEMMMAPFEERFGAPVARDLDSNGIGLFDAHCLGFPCGLEAVVWRFHLGQGLQSIAPVREPSFYEIHANQRDLAHLAFHLGVPEAKMTRWTDLAGKPDAPDLARRVVLMRLDDNGNEYEVARFTNRCEGAEAQRMYEARGHKQLYSLVVPEVPPPLPQFAAPLDVVGR